VGAALSVEELPSVPGAPWAGELPWVEADRSAGELPSESAPLLGLPVQSVPGWVTLSLRAR